PPPRTTRAARAMMSRRRPPPRFAGGSCGDFAGAAGDGAGAADAAIALAAAVALAGVVGVGVLAMTCWATGNHAGSHSVIEQGGCRGPLWRFLLGDCGEVTAGRTAG